jgi:ABC-type dipeptide/oligopeptide/nickel transport system permease component
MKITAQHLPSSTSQEYDTGHENIFGLPGVGRSMITAINNSDMTQLQINVLFYGLAIMVINLIVDISYTWFDPRVRYS